MRIKKEKSVEKPIPAHTFEEDKFPAYRLALGMIVLAGVLPVVLVAPGILKLFGTYQKLHRRYQSPAYIEGIVGTLQRRGLVRIYHKGSREYITLTDKGRLYYAKRIGKQATKKPSTWDGKWRVLTFDISEKERVKRDLLRHSITNFGFIKLQDSVWIYPYDCEELIMLLKGQVKIGKELLYMTVEKLENDTWLKKKFALIKK